MPAFRRIVIVMLENASRDTVLGNQYMSDLRQKGVFLSNSHGVTHPSQPNYIVLTGGDTLGIDSDDADWVSWIDHSEPATGITSVVDLLESAGKTWKAYAEDLPSGPLPQYPDAVPDSGLFARRHVPFLVYPNIMNTQSRIDCIVNAQQNFANDVKTTMTAPQSQALPEYSFYTPNLVNDGHNDTSGNRASSTDGQNLKNIQAFLTEFLGPGDNPTVNFPPETLIVITFDEAYPVTDPYNIYTLLIGDMLEAGTVRSEPYNHYSLLRSVEVNFGLGSLGRNDVAATPYWFLQCL